MTPGGRRVTCVAAVGPDGVIGDGPRIPWRVPGEQAVFKDVTWGHVLVMGRTTYESIGRPLPGRTTVVLTRSRTWSAGHDGVLLAHDLDHATRTVDRIGTPVAGDPPRQMMVVGGAEVYAAALAAPDLVDRQVLSEISPEAVDLAGADALERPVRYPAFERGAWVETGREPHPGFDVVTWERVPLGG